MNEALVMGGKGTSNRNDHVRHNVMKKRVGNGKKKIVNMERIPNKSSRQVTFSKRKGGLFKKTAQLCSEFGVEAAVFTFSEGGNVFSFGNPDAETVIRRHVTGAGKDDASTLSNNAGENKCKFWWDQRVDSMGLDELEQFKTALECLRIEVASRVDDWSRKSELNPMYTGCFADPTNCCTSIPQSLIEIGGSVALLSQRNKGRDSSSAK